jgi:hypothetical protein
VSVQIEERVSFAHCPSRERNFGATHPSCLRLRACLASRAGVFAATYADAFERVDCTSSPVADPGATGFDASNGTGLL